MIKIPADALIGVQWGDEGKGKIADVLVYLGTLAREEMLAYFNQLSMKDFYRAYGELPVKYRLAARFNGGPNAGHTVNIDGKDYIFHGVPVAVLFPDIVKVIGNGCVINPARINEELGMVTSIGIPVEKGKFYISDSAHLILPYHIREEQISAASKSIGTTLRGIGPAYTDKTRRTGIRVHELMREGGRESLRAKIEQHLDPSEFLARVKMDAEEMRLADPYAADTLMTWAELGARLLSGAKGHYAARAEEILTQLEKDFEPLKKYVADTADVVRESLRRGEEQLLEGAQGTFLDLDHGTYPFVTSSHTTAGGTDDGLGVGPGDIRRVIGVAKAYTTRVGEGPFPTEFLGEKGSRLRENGNEYGSTTHRPRRCGPLDLMLLKRSHTINRFTQLAVTKLDVLDEEENLPVCVGYKIDGKPVDTFPTDTRDLARCKPIYEILPGWKTPTTGIRRWDDLPPEARNYMERMEKIDPEKPVPVAIVSAGKDRKQTIFRGKIAA